MKLDGKVVFVPFSGSVEYNKVHSETYMHNMMYVSTAARCNVYRANIKLLAMNRLSTDFVNAVANLPLDDYGPYLQFISIYGTHYISSMVMGAKAMVHSEFEQTVWNSLKQQKFDFNAAAQASFWVVTLKLNAKVCSSVQYRFIKYWRSTVLIAVQFNPLMGTGNYSATSNNMKSVHWRLIGRLLRLVQQGGDWAGPQSAQSPHRCTKCNSPPIDGQCTNHRIAV